MDGEAGFLVRLRGLFQHKAHMKLSWSKCSVFRAGLPADAERWIMAAALLHLCLAQDKHGEV
jgi:hypothetical protein